jgi:hypothetical protein
MEEEWREENAGEKPPLPATLNPSSQREWDMANGKPSKTPNHRLLTPPERTWQDHLRDLRLLDELDRLG